MSVYIVTGCEMDEEKGAGAFLHSHIQPSYGAHKASCTMVVKGQSLKLTTLLNIVESLSMLTYSR
jgi:hypothetical protein